MGLFIRKSPASYSSLVLNIGMLTEGYVSIKGTCSKSTSNHLLEKESMTCLEKKKKVFKFYNKIFILLFVQGTNTIQEDFFSLSPCLFI